MTLIKSLLLLILVKNNSKKPWKRLTMTVWIDFLISLRTYLDSNIWTKVKERDFFKILRFAKWAKGGKWIQLSMTTQFWCLITTYPHRIRDQENFISSWEAVSYFRVTINKYSQSLNCPRLRSIPLSQVLRKNRNLDQALVKVLQKVKNRVLCLSS